MKKLLVTTIISRIKEFENNKLDERTKEFLGLKGVRTDADVAKLLGLSPQSLSNHKAKSTIPHKAVTLYGLKNKLSINRLLEGLYE